jgi:hypothetical protein
MMRRFFIPTILMGLALLCMATQWASAAAPRRKATTKCSSGRSHVVVADAQAQVYEAPESPNLPEYLSVFGCAYGRRKPYVLGIPLGAESSSGSAGITNEVLAGPIVAYEKSLVQPGSGFTSYIVFVRDLRTGRVLRKVPTGPSTIPNPNLVGAGSTTAIVVKSDGAVAWIVETFLKSGEKFMVGFEVHAVDSTGNRMLASGPDIERHSLALVGSTLYWTQGGKPMSAVLH